MRAGRSVHMKTEGPSRARALALLLVLALGLGTQPGRADDLGRDAGSGGAASVDEQVTPQTRVQWHLALASGVQFRQAEDARWWNGLSGHVLLGRARDSDFGFGPYLRLANAWGADTTLGAGASALVPAHSAVPVIVSLGGLAGFESGAPAPGIEAWLFVGPSVYNFHSHYSMASGLLVGVQRWWGDQPMTSLTCALQLDLALAAIPFIALVELLRGPPD